MLLAVENTSHLHFFSSVWAVFPISLLSSFLQLIPSYYHLVLLLWPLLYRGSLQKRNKKLPWLIYHILLWIVFIPPLKLRSTTRNSRKWQHHLNYSYQNKYNHWFKPNSLLCSHWHSPLLILVTLTATIEHILKISYGKVVCSLCVMLLLLFLRWQA